MPPIDNPAPDEENTPREENSQPFVSSSGDFSLSGVGEDDGRSFQSAWDQLRAGAGSGAQLSEGSSGERTRQQAVLTALASSTGWAVPYEAVQALPVLSNETSEHEVRYHPSDDFVVKVTWPGWYGQVPVVRDGKLQRTEANPAQYLVRFDLHNAVFGSRVRFVGVTISDQPSLVIGEPPGQPSLVILQPFHRAADQEYPNPSPSEIDTFMRGQGFLVVKGSYFGWVRLADGVVVTDAKPDNFVLTAAGIVPIDLQIAQFEPVLLQPLVVD